MSRELNRATARIIFPGLVAGGLAGAAIGFEQISQPVGVSLAILLGVLIGFSVLQARNKVKKAQAAVRQAQSDA